MGLHPALTGADAHHPVQTWLQGEAKGPSLYRKMPYQCMFEVCKIIFSTTSLRGLHCSLCSGAACLLEKTVKLV